MNEDHEKLTDPEKLAALKRLGANEDFQKVFLPNLLERAEHHARQCRNKDLAPEKRAEHIEAAALAEDLLTYLDVRQSGLEARIEARIGQKKRGN